MTNEDDFLYMKRLNTQHAFVTSKNTESHDSNLKSVAIIYDEDYKKKKLKPYSK